MHSAYEATALPPSDSASAIWNPDAAANWSLVFTPAFGAYIQMRNWKALGEPGKADSARKWFYASLGMLVMHMLAGALNARLNNESSVMHWIGLWFLMLWYFASARPQAKVVKARFGAGYPRKPWDQAMLGAVIAGTAYLSISALVSYAFVAIT
jgi:hypothetical protein